MKPIVFALLLMGAAAIAISLPPAKTSPVHDAPATPFVVDNSSEVAAIKAELERLAAKNDALSSEVVSLKDQLAHAQEPLVELTPAVQAPIVFASMNRPLVRSQACANGQCGPAAYAPMRYIQPQQYAKQEEQPRRFRGQSSGWRPGKFLLGR